VATSTASTDQGPLSDKLGDEGLVIAVVERDLAGRVLLRGVSWKTYEALLAEVENHEVGSYVEKPRSRAFPFLGPEPVTRFLLEAHATDETTWIRGFRRWVRETLPVAHG